MTKTVKLLGLSPTSRYFVSAHLNETIIVWCSQFGYRRVLGWEFVTVRNSLLSERIK